MSADDPLYERFGRQIALPEVGVEGQRRLAEEPVDLGAWPPEAASLYRRAGGVPDPAGVAVERSVGELPSPGAAFGAAAWGAVEAARRVLGQAPAAMPSALVQRLGGRAP